MSLQYVLCMDLANTSLIYNFITSKTSFHLSLTHIIHFGGRSTVSRCYFQSLFDICFNLVFYYLIV